MQTAKNKLFQLTNSIRLLLRVGVILAITMTSFLVQKQPVHAAPSSNIIASVLAKPGSFTKTSPAKAATKQSTNPTLSWGTSRGASSYKYCINTTASCKAPAAWISTGTSTQVTLNGLTQGKKYYWQVKSSNAAGTTNTNRSSTAWWSFTVANPISPTATNVPPTATPTATSVSPTPTSPSSAISFFNNWVQGITGPGRWKGIQEVASDRMQTVTDPVQVGGKAVRVEVRPGDDPINSSGERAEAVFMTDSIGNYINENGSSGTQYYAFSIQLPLDWVPPANDTHGLHWGICFQLHGPDTLGTSPAFAFEVTNAFSVDILTGDLDTPTAKYSHAYIALSDGSLNLGQWVDFVIGIKFAKNFTGSIHIWRRNEGQTQFTQVLSLANIPTLQYRSSLGGVGDHYWKYGYYRADQTTVTSILYLGAIARGTSFTSVITTAFR